MPRKCKTHSGPPCEQCWNLAMLEGKDGPYYRCFHPFELWKSAKTVGEWDVISESPVDLDTAGRLIGDRPETPEWCPVVKLRQILP